MSFKAFPLKTFVFRQISARTLRTRSLAILSLLLITTISVQAQTPITFQNTLSSFYEYGVSMFYGAPKRGVKQDDKRATRRTSDKNKSEVTAPNAVPCTFNGTTRTVPAGGSIQAAINASNPAGGDTVQVAAGTFTEQLIINKCVNIVGASQGSTIIQAPATLISSTVPDGSNPGQTINARSIVEIRSNSFAAISGVTVSGPFTNPGAGPVFGILVVENGALNLSSARITTVREEPIQGNQNGFAIQIGSFDFNQIGAATLNNVTVDQYQKSGVIVSRTGSDAQITNSTITGIGATAAIAQNGVEVSDGATATITGSTITNNLCDNSTCGPDAVNQSQSGGVILFDSGVVTVSNNQINNNDVGFLSGVNDSTTQITLSGNTLTGNRYFGIQVEQINLLVQNNIISGVSNVGAIVLSDLYGPNDDNSIVNFQNNSITGASQAGIQLLDVDQSNTFIPVVTANFNRIANSPATGTAVVGIDADGSPTSTVNAENNFFGCNNGANGAGCDTTTGVVDSDPFLILTGTTATPSTIGTGGTSAIATFLRSTDTAQTGTFTLNVPAAVSFTSDVGTVASPVALNNGTATTTFTGDTFSGNRTGTVTAQLNNATDSTPITVNDTFAPTVTIAVANGQDATTSNQPVNFTVTFNEVVTGFDPSDITLSGPASGGAIVTVSGSSGTTFNVQVSNITAGGALSATVNPNAAQDPALNFNTAGSNTATVNFVFTPPRDCTMSTAPFDVEADFSLGSNPNCEYTYGYTADNSVDSAFTQYPLRQADVPVAGIDRWHRDNPDPDLVPAVFGNRNPGTTQYGSVQQPADALNLHPGEAGERSVVRFTVPAGAAGFYKINGNFEGLDATSTDVVIVRRSGTTNTTLFSSAINGFGNSQVFDVPVNLAVGDIVDFSVGFGNGSYGSDSTGLRAVLTPVTVATETIYAVTEPGLILTNADKGEEQSPERLGIGGGGNGQRLVSFSSTDPNTILTDNNITGLVGSDEIVAIDFRPRNRILYALGRSGSIGRIYTINTANGAATQVNATNTIALSGTEFGFDFNPAVDRIRLISDSGQNLRINPDSGAIQNTDTVLNTDPAPAPSPSASPSPTPRTGVSAAAYTNNTFPGPPAAGTTLYDIAADTNELFIQSPPNSGTLVLVGPLGVDASLINGFDISSAGSTMMTPVNNPYASFLRTSDASNSDLYIINLTSGAATRIGRIGGIESDTDDGLAITGLAVTPIGGVGADATFPTVTSIVRAGNTPTNAATVDFTVTFSEIVTGVDAADFALVQTGVTGAVITNVAGSGTTYTVSVSTGTGDGTIGLNLVDNDTIVDASNNQLGGAGANNGNFTGEVYTIDKTRPTVSVTTTSSNPTPNQPISFTITFSESVADFMQSEVTVSNGTIASFNGSGTTYTVTVTPNGNGPVSVSVAENVANDQAGNGNQASNVATVVFDTTAPTAAITQAAGQTDPTSASPVNFTVTFSEAVNGFTSTDVLVSGTAFSANVPPTVVVTPNTGSGTIFNVAVSGMTNSGTVIINVGAGAANDQAGNPSAAATATDNTVTFVLVNTEVVVSPADRMGWNFLEEGASGDSLGSFVTGPATPPLPEGSARLVIDNITGLALARAAGNFAGTRFADITALSYGSYQNRAAVQSNDPRVAVSLQFDVDSDVTDGNTTFQGRLVYEPVYDSGQTVQPNVWQTFDTLSSTARFYGTGSGPNRPVSNACTTTNPCTRAQLLAQFPNIGIRSTASGIYLKVGSGIQGGFDGNTDALTIGVNSNNTTFNFEADPPLITVSDATVTEGASGTTDATFTITLSQAVQSTTAPAQPLDTRVTVNTANGTAMAGSDYTAITNQVVIIPAGQTSATFTVSVNGDMVLEPDETFTVNLTNAVNGQISDAQGVGTITNDDSTISFTSGTYTVNEQDGTALITLTRAGSTASAVSVDFATSDGSAMSTGVNADYTATSGTATFAVGASTASFTVPINNDIISEVNETVNLTLSNVMGGATLGLSSAVLTIVDNDGGGLVFISGTITTPNGSGGFAPLQGVTVTLSGSASGTDVTDANGNYSFEGLPAGGNFLVTPTLSGYTFEPINRSFGPLFTSTDEADFVGFINGNVPRTVRVVNTFGTPGQTATVPIELVSQGNENSLTFTLVYNSAILTNPVVTPGSDSTGGTTVTAAPNSTPGRLGITVERPINSTFASGVRQIALVTFTVNSTTAIRTPIDFGDAPPLDREINNNNADPLPANYVSGNVIFAQGFEADVAGRPTGNGSVNGADITVLRSLIANPSTIDNTTNEFQRADNAPRGTLGNGALNGADITQARRYVAGQDGAPVPAGGPFQPTTSFPGEQLLALSGIGQATEIDVSTIGATAGSTVTVPINVTPTSREAAYSFRLDYNTARLTNPVASAGAKAAGAFVSGTPQPDGSFIILVDFNGGVIAPGTGVLVNVQFTVAATAPTGIIPITIRRPDGTLSVSDLQGDEITPLDISNGGVNISGGATAATVSVGGQVTDGKAGSPLKNARVSFTAQNGATYSATTNSFGYYRVREVPAGGTYVVQITARRLNFAAQTVTINGETDNLDFNIAP